MRRCVPTAACPGAGPTGHDGIYTLPGWPPTWRQRLLAAVPRRPGRRGRLPPVGRRPARGARRRARRDHRAAGRQPPETCARAPRVRPARRADAAHRHSHDADRAHAGRPGRRLPPRSASNGPWKRPGAEGSPPRAGSSRRAGGVVPVPRSLATCSRAGRRAGPTGSHLEVRLVQLVRAAGLPEPVRRRALLPRLRVPQRRSCVERDRAARTHWCSPVGRSCASPGRT